MSDEELREKQEKFDQFRREFQDLFNKYKDVFGLSSEFKYTLTIRDNGSVVLEPNF